MTTGRVGAGACTTVRGQARRVHVGRLVTISRSGAGVTPSRSEVSSSIIVIGARQQRHLDARQVRRQCTTVRAPSGRVAFTELGILLLRLGVFFGDRLLEGFESQSRP